MSKRMFPFILYIVMGISIVAFFGCNKLLEVEAPKNSMTSENIYSNDATAAAVLTGLYTNMCNANLSRALQINAISAVAGLSADELILFGGSANANQTFLLYYQNRVNPGASTLSSASFWSSLYADIYILNIALEKLEQSKGLNPTVRQHLIGEAKFLRAFNYFYLVNLYGDIPLAVSSDYRKNAVLPRNAHADVYAQIISDLKDAQQTLSDNYLSDDAYSGTEERVRPNKWAATALLSRTYLYAKQWRDAAEQASLLIQNKAQYDTVALDKVFLMNSKEAIWQLQPVNAGWNTEEGRLFVLQDRGPTSNVSIDGNPVYLSDFILNSFESGDKRTTEWVNNVVANGTTYYYPYKYRNARLNNSISEYSMVLRLGEQYLIRAEANAMLNRLAEARNDIDVIRTRAGLPAVDANDQSSIVNAILRERKVELFTEWGHRWLDLKRSGTVNETMLQVAPTKGTTWSNKWQWYPIPLYDIIQNDNLVQNDGY
ncbi:MAG: RagB/SusD family nutrient uptake outer membrane protein [Candidatus Pseudobacter hemicellulosilyticus]|uniref:RagB/SusD family nutrient uptake outer membrane protein n=1 Tax=Candidatus Pseudobacter hemicellulosilyticus TaxID=3121375 RepID=A0AAJ5WWX4_9BACT|nr:MAG: RagB/SusD family nutrient uptake outer membrane protein [Pseudobacter sp.]